MNRIVTITEKMRDFSFSPQDCLNVTVELALDEV